MNQQWRQALSYPDKLPVSQAREEILAALKQHQVLILQSETGSGKSTQIPKMLLECFDKEQPKVGMTQPRRLPTKLLAQRLNQELSGGAAHWVGWQVRFEKHLHPRQVVKVMTEGVLWQELIHHKLLKSYDALILDEVHERSITMDLLLGAMPEILKRRPEFRLVLLSATLEKELFQNFFPQAHFLELSGRSYPIEDYYCPESLDDPLEKLLWALDQAQSLAGDLLVFCATESEILFYEKRLSQLRPVWEYCCLYARMLHRQQKTLFQKSQKRRVILSTNVAETSVTLPSVRVVIDLGRQKILMFHPQYRVNSYPIVAASQQSVIQRRGRAGRTQPGWCFHLYSQNDLEQRPAALSPEIQRSSLSQVVLQVLCLRAGSVEKFPFISPPSLPQLREAMKLLRLLGLIDEKDRLQPQGRQVARYPLDPRFCMVLLEAQQSHCGYSVAVIVAFLSGDDPRLRPGDSLEKADKAHLRYHDLRSDFMSILSLWVDMQSQKSQRSRKDFQQYCYENFLNPISLRQWELQVKQLCELVHIKPKTLDARRLEEDFFLIHRALLAGFFDRLYRRLPKKPGRSKHYQGAQGVQAYIHPSSVLKGRSAEWVFAIDQHHDPSGQTRLRWVGPVELAVAQKYLKEHTRYQYSPPFYSEESGEVMVHKTGQAWGLEILPPSAELYRLLEPQDARRFLCAHFVGQWAAQNFKAVPHWQQAWTTAQALCQRSRHFGALLTDSELAEKIWQQNNWPEILVSRATIERYQHTLPQLTPSFFLRQDIGLSLKDFPDVLSVEGTEIAVEYDPDPEDFLHYTIPARMWRCHQPSSWLVCHPYYGPALILAVLQQLGKKERTAIGDLQECAVFFCSEYEREQSLWRALQDFLWRYYDIKSSEKDFKVYQIPRYLLPHFWIDHGDRIDYLAVYQFDDDSRLHDPHFEDTETQQPWLEVAQSARRGLWRCYDPERQYWESYKPEQYWSWKAALMQSYAEQLWKDSPSRLKSQMFPQGLLASPENLRLWRGITLGQCWGFDDFLLESPQDACRRLEKDRHLTKHYRVLAQVFSQELQPAWRQLEKKNWPLEWSGLKEALKLQLFLGHLSPELFRRWPQWFQALTVALEKAQRKQKLLAQWQKEWLHLVEQVGSAPLDPAHPMWVIALEGIMALFDQSQTPIVPWSEKKILKLAEQTDNWLKPWP